MTTPHLSPQEEAACFWVERGETDHVIALHLKCSPRTVRFHIENAARRLARFHGWTYTLPRKIIHRHYAGDRVRQAA